MQRDMDTSPRENSHESPLSLSGTLLSLRESKVKRSNVTQGLTFCVSSSCPLLNLIKITKESNRGVTVYYCVCNYLA